MKKIFSLMIGLFIFSLGIFAAVPHSYVTENPNKEVAQTETLKRKDKAELNLTITKKNSKEAKVERAFYNTTTGVFYIVINGKEYNIAPDDNLLISNKLEEFPNLSTTNGRKKINKMFNTREINYKMESNGNWRNIQTTFEELPKEVYINVLDRNYNLKDVLNLKDIKITRMINYKSIGELYGTIIEGYSGVFKSGVINIDNNISTKYSFNKSIVYNKSKLIFVGDYQLKTQIFNLNSNEFDDSVSYRLKEFYINDKKEVYNSTTFPNKRYNISQNLILETINTTDILDNYLGFKLIKFPHEDFSFKVQAKYDNTMSYEDATRTYYFTYKRASTDGESNLNIDSSYKNEYIKYDSCTIENLQPVSLLNPVQGVSINQVWGDGILEFKSGDTLRINRVQHTLNYSGLSEKRTNLNGIDLSYQVVNNKLQLKINGYEPGISSSQPLDIEVEREIREQGTTFTRKVLKHTINITVPNIQTLSGNSTLTFGENYPVNTYVNFNANSSLTDTNPLQLENSVQGITFNTTGNGILQVKSGDRLSVNGNKMAVGYNNNIDPQKLRVGNLDYTYKVENGKFRLSLNDWGVLEPDRNIEVKVLRDNKVVSTHNFTVKAPRKVTGNSNLNIDKQYTPGTTIRFQGISLTAPNIGGIEPPLPPGVNYSTTDGYGIPFMQDGDILEINDGVTRVARSFNISSNGTLGLQTIKMTTSELGLSVQSGKLRLALTKWFSDSPINLNLTLKRGTNKIMEHTLVINVPSVPKVEGVSNLAIDNSYKNEYIKFNSCTLDNLQPISLVNTITGVTLNSLSGNGLLTLEQGDILSVNGQQNTINYGNLADQNLVLNGINLSYKVENGKVQLRINSYDMGITSAQPLTIKITRNSNEIMSHTMNITVPNIQKLVGQSSLTIAKEYGNEYIPFTSCTLENQQNIGLERAVNGITLQQTTGKGLLTLENGDTLTVNRQPHTISYGNLTEKTISLNGINLSYQVISGKLQLRVNSYDLGITQAQPLTLIVNRAGKEIMNHTMNITVPNVQKLVGQSSLTIAKEYGNEYIPFTSCTLENQQNISLERAVNGVTLQQTTGKGLLTLENGDTLTVNGRQHMLNSNSLVEQNTTVNGIYLSYKVENGKVQLRVNNYDMGIAQAQSLTLTVNRTGKEVMNHTMNITVPNIQKIVGESQLTIDEGYKNEDILFDSCTVDNLKPISLISPITGVTLNSLSGNGLLELKANDTLSINGQQHILNSNNLLEQTLSLGSIKLSYKVVAGKVQLKINSYGLGITQAQPLTIKLTRDNKEIMQHIINIKVPNIQKLVGESDLSITNEYNNDYMIIKGCTLENPQNISFVSSVTGATINQFSGKGILKFETGDILEINGVQSTVNSTGGVSERSENIGGISTSYKAQNGNLQIRIIDYPLNQQSPQMYNIKLYRKGIQVLEHTMKIFVPEIIVDNSKTNVKIRDEYKEEVFNIASLPYNVKGIEYMSGNDKIKVYTPNNYRSRLNSYYFNYLKINGITIAGKQASIIKARTLNLNGVIVEVQESGDLFISLKNYAKKISKPFELNIESQNVTVIESNGGSDNSHGTRPPHRAYSTSKATIVFYYVPSKVVGNSTLEVKEYYPTPEYIEFNSCPTPDPKPIALENSLRDVKVIQNSGNGLVNLENGDILELNGKEYHIGVGGNLPEQQDTLGEINFKFKVKNGKLRLALTSWGVLEPDRILTINAKRETYSIMEHKMTIQSPRRVEGKASLVFNKKYPIREIIRFQGISLTAPNVGGIEPPIPAGVKYNATEGYGIPFMKEGDILEIITPNQRAVQKYTIDKNNGLNNFVLDLPGTTLSLGVNSGKLRLGLNNWLVNKDSVLNLRIVRGVNEICNMNLTLEVPKAPFDILKNGILDFGRVIQGSKNKKAETSILLDMHRDVSDVKFNLSTENPELINSTGKSLNARNLQAGVHKQGKNRYLVRVIGSLDVPSDQELGVYRGSVLLNVTIK